VPFFRGFLAGPRRRVRARCGRSAIMLRVGRAAARLDVSRGTSMAGYVARPDAVSAEPDRAPAIALRG